MTWDGSFFKSLAAQLGCFDAGPRLWITKTRVELTEPRKEREHDRDGKRRVGSRTGTWFGGRVCGVETGSTNKNPRKIVFIKMIKARLCMLCDKHGLSDWDIPLDVSLLTSLFDDDVAPILKMRIINETCFCMPNIHF